MSVLTQREYANLLADLQLLEAVVQEVIGELVQPVLAATISVAGLSEAIAAVDEDLAEMAPENRLEIVRPFPKRKLGGAA